MSILLTLSDYSVHSKDSDTEVEDNDSDGGPRRRSRAISLQYSSDSDCEMSTESHSNNEVWSDVKYTRFYSRARPNFFPIDEKSGREVVELFVGNDLFQLMINESNMCHHQRKISEKENVKVVKKYAKDDYTRTPSFFSIMPRKRFCQIWRTRRRISSF